MKEPYSAGYLERIREIFERVSPLPVEEQGTCLDEACGDDKELRREVEALLLEATTDDSEIEQLAKNMIWPAFESLKHDPSQLNVLLDDDRDKESPKQDPFIGKLVSQFEILAPIGRGGMGMVYRASDQELDRTVALKFLPPSLSSDREAKDRFINEAKAASVLDHPNIATVYEIGETEDQQMFIAMGYYSGETLKEKTAKGPIAPKLAIDYAVQLASALDKAHQHGVIHRDIKPGNLMITEEGTIKLLDFGLAKLSYSSGYTQVGQMMGTVAYMSPEQARANEVDQRTDLWSLGIVLYEMLTGRRPFDGDDAQSAIHAILFEDPLPPSAPENEIPNSIKAIIGLCLAKNRTRRYQTAGDLLEDLLRAQEGLAPMKRGGGATWNSRVRRRRWALLSSVVTILLVGVFSIHFLFASDQVTFTRITEGAIVEDKGNFLGCSWGDYDQDGYLDVFVANNGEGAFNHLYHNNGDGTFSRVVKGILVTDPLSSTSPGWADQDNDGDLDLFVCTDNDSLDAFYRNDGNGHFSKVTTGDWVNTPGWGHVVAWGDYDNDGFLDLYVGNYGTPEPQRNFLYHNNGDGTMEGVNSAANELPGPTHGCLWSDYDEDGDLDLFVGGQDKVQFRNDQDGVFTWIHPQDGGIPRSTEDEDVSFSSADYDNDGDLDLLYVTWEMDPSNLLYRNEGGRRFVDVTHVLPSGGSIRGTGSAWGDYDNDGFQDLFISNRIGKNLLYHNQGNGSFKRITKGPVVTEGNSESAGCAWVDYDNDGYLDLFVANGMWNIFAQSCELFRNNGGANHWITLNLVGTVSNRSAIGTKVWARARIEGQEIVQFREIQGGGNGKNQIGSRAHFGLGDSTNIDTLRVEWPSGHIQELSNVAANQFLTIEESGVE